MSLTNPLLRNLSACLCLSLILSSCSNSNTNNDVSSQASPKNIDKFEGINRKIFYFNVGVDNFLLKPVAKAYKSITPAFVDKSVGNFFGNLGDVGNAINNVLQFKFKDAANDTERFVFNSTFGFVGLLDVASEAGIPRSDEDFGQTLAKWGVKSGPYVMLPFLGPSTIRDASAKITVDRFTDPAHYSDENIALFVVETIKKRSDLFAEEAVLNSLSDDKYSAIRDIWLQNREFRINDGKINKKTGSELIDELERLDSL